MVYTVFIRVHGCGFRGFRLRISDKGFRAFGA